MKLLRFSCVAFLGLAACSAAPTEPAAFDAAPSFAEELGPNMMGSGNFSDGGSSLGSGNFYDDGGTGDDAITSTTEDASADTTGRGTNMIGSGN